MYKALLYSLFFVFVAQVKAASSLPLMLQMKLQKIDAQTPIHLIVEAEPTKMLQYIESSGIAITSAKKNIFLIKILKHEIDAFARQEFVTRIEDGSIPVQLMMDTALINNNVVSIHQGAAPLTKPYTGKGVIMGIVDDGIDWRHQDFRKADSTTRVLYLWDQNNATPSKAPLPYNYGQEWTAADINASIITYMEPASSFSHGSNVTGIAAGNGRASGFNKGNAPDADLIIVAPKYTGNFTNNVVDAVDYIFKKADAMGKPCVVNTSLGTYYGSHDGKDLSAKMIDFLLDERKGRALVAAAGNAGGFKYHLGYLNTGTNDTVFTWFKYLASINGLYFDFWADSAALNQVRFAISADSAIAPFAVVSKPIWFNYQTDFPGLFTQKTATISKNIFSVKNAFIGTASIQIDIIDGRFFIQVNIIPNSQAYNWRLMSTGMGAYDLWSHPSLTGTSLMVETGLPDTSLYPEFKKYRLPDNKKNIVSSWQCSDKVITVGNYNNCNYFIDVDNIQRYSGYAPGVIFPSSSQGPTRDNRIKPDITAPGNFVVSAVGLNTRAAFLAGGDRIKVAKGSWHMRNGGTSMASPQVAGAAALFLESNPSWGYMEIKQLLLKAARIDTYTTANLPNNIWGYGKLDAFSAMTYPAIFGCRDTGSINYNPLANIDDGACIKKVYGCMDTGSINYNKAANVDNNTCIKKVYGCTDSFALNYNPNANVDNGTCIYKSAIQLPKSGLFIYPNPVKSSLMVYSETEEISDIKIINAIGQLIDKPMFSIDKRKFNLELTTLESGIFTLRLTFLDGKNYNYKFLKH